ncbi:hypothetical protein I4U23_007770 [Adineta vaga]|nr:hypothetical protein I4U23_007770 [Adineta vaga]
MVLTITIMKQRLFSICFLFSCFITGFAMNSDFRIAMDFTFIQDKQWRNTPLIARICLKCKPSIFYYLKGIWNDDNRLKVEQVQCISSQRGNPYCKWPSNVFFLLQYTPKFDNLTLHIEKPTEDLKDSLRRFTQSTLASMTEYNLTCTLREGSFVTADRPRNPYPYGLSNTSLFGVIFLGTCVVLVCGLCTIWFSVFYYRRFIQQRKEKKTLEELAKSTEQMLAKSPIIIFDLDNKDEKYGDDDPLCAICLEPFKAKERIRKLGCAHYYHLDCIDPWLISHQSCPLCNRNILRSSIPSISSTVMRAINDRNHGEITTDINSNHIQAFEVANSNL